MTSGIRPLDIGYNARVGSSDHVDTLTHDARVLATTQEAGVAASIEVVAR